MIDCAGACLESFSLETKREKGRREREEAHAFAFRIIPMKFLGVIIWYFSGINFELFLRIHSS